MTEESTEYNCDSTSQCDCACDSEYDDEAAEYKAAMKKYLLLCFLMEGSKMILFYFIFAHLHLTSQYIVALLVLMAVRCNGGGLHCQHYISCFLLSLSVLAGCICCGIYLPLNRPLALILLFLCSITGYLTVPIVSSNRPRPDAALIRQSKRRTVVTIILYMIIICICPAHPYVNIGSWTIIIHVLQLLLAKYLQRRRNYV